MLREKLNIENKSGALGFVIRQLANYLEESVHHWDPNGDYGSGMALGR